MPDLLHAFIKAASLVKAGSIQKQLLLVAGGCTAKLGMNGKDHVKKVFQFLEDYLSEDSLVVLSRERWCKPRKL